MNTPFRNLLITLALTAGLSGCLAEESAQEYLDKAQTRFDGGEWELAQVELRNAVRVDPDVADAHYLQARLFERTQNWRGMKGALEHALSLDPAHWQASLDLAKVYLMMNELELASESAEKVLSVQPEEPTALVLLGAIRLQQKDTTASYRLAEQAYAIEATNPDAVALITSHWLKDLEFQRSLGAIDAAIAAHPDNHVMHLLGISVAGQLDDNPAVVARFKALIAAQPEDLNFRKALARVYINNDDIDGARALLAQSVADLPDNIDAKVTYARFLAAESLEAAAESLVEFIAVADEERNDLRFMLAELRLRQGQTDAAQGVYAQISADGTSEQAAQATTQLASLAISQEDLRVAGELIDQALVADPGNPRALLMRSHLKLLRRETDAAIADIRVVLRDDPASAAAHSQLGRAYLQHSASELAEQAFHAALEQNEKHAYAARELARIYISRRDFAKARVVLEPARAANPADADLTRLLVMTELALANYADAESLAAKADPAIYGTAYLQLIEGVSLQAQARYDEAIALFEQIIEQQPEAADGALMALAQTYQAADRTQELDTYLLATLAERPDLNSARELLAQSYRSSNQLSKAEALIRAGLDDGWLKGYQLLALVLVEQDRAEEAFEIYEGIVSRNPDSIGLRLQMASLAESIGDPAKAAALYEQVLVLNPAADVAANNLAMLLVKQGDYEQALVQARRFENSQVPYFMDTLGWIQHLNGNHAKAVELFKQALAQLPDNAEIRYHAGIALLALSSEAEARENLEKALELAEVNGPFDGIEDANRVLATLI